LVVFNVISVEGEALAGWVHELIHCNVQASRLHRGLHGRFGAKTGGRELLAAELGSVLLEHQLGIGSASESKSADLGHCLERPKERPQMLDGCLRRQGVRLSCQACVGVLGFGRKKRGGLVEWQNGQNLR
jgi:hypothetical protein